MRPAACALVSKLSRVQASRTKGRGGRGVANRPRGCSPLLARQSAYIPDTNLWLLVDCLKPASHWSD